VAASSAAGLAALVQKNVIELHAMGSRAPAVDKPDLIVMDFDPAPDVSFKKVVEGARELREILTQLKLESFVKVTGGKGLHVHVPFSPNHGWDKIKAFAHALAREMANRHPELYTTQMAKAARTGKIFLDYLRNGEGATAVVPYSLRAKPISAVAMPVEWEDLGRLKGADQFTLPLALGHLKKRKRDPWERYFKVKQKLTLLGA
jgi:bifunctional non-homologous end joining protein LigD